MDARNSHGVREKFSWALPFTAVVAACLALAECGAWAQGATDTLVSARVQEQIQRLADIDPIVRRNAASALGQIGPSAKEAATFLIVALAKDTDAGVRGSAAQALGAIGPGVKEALPALSAALTKDTDRIVRLDAMLS